MTADNDYPRLSAGSEKLRDPGRFIRSAAELSDGQFALLAAAWAEGCLDDQGTAELTTVTGADPARRAVVDSFLRLKLEPLPDHWAGKRKAIHTPERLMNVTRIAASLTAAAAVILAAVIIHSPEEADLSHDQIITLPSVAVVAGNEADIVRPSLLAQTKQELEKLPVEPVTPSAGLSETVVTREAPVPVSPAIIATGTGRLSETPAANSLEKVKFTTVPSKVTSMEEKGWIAGAVNRLLPRSKNSGSGIDGYGIASSCIKGLNNAFGWDMELDARRDQKGDVSSVNFTSALVTISAPVKNNGE